VGGKPNSPLRPEELSITSVDPAKKTVAIQVGWQEPEDNGAPLTGYELWMAEEEQSF
jgi:hypothetical protein